jgi:polysaccharide biosynthesis transport protein
MKKRPLTQLSDYIDLVTRRKWWIIIPALVVPLLVFCVGRKLPKVYKSETLILVAPQKVPTDYVKPTVNGDVSDRLQTLSQQILSRTRLDAVIDEFNLYPQMKKTTTRDQVVERMRSDITVEIVADPRPERRSIGAFRISYMGSDPAVVQAVVQRLSSLFISENLKAREMQANGTTAFIEDALAQTKAKLADQEDAIRKFKAQNMGSLPEQEQANLTVLSQLQASLQSASDDMGRAEQQRVYLESMLAAYDKAGPSGKSSGLPKRLEDLRSQLAVAEQMYTPQHPDVIRLKHDVAAVEAQIANSHGSAADEPDVNRSQLTAIRQEIAAKKAKKAQIEQQIERVQGHIAMLPSVEMRFADLNRDYETTKAQYKTLLEKKDSSLLAADMEKRAEGEQFQVLDPANYPQTPIKPDLAQLNAMGLLGGIGLGLGLAFLSHMRDNRIHSMADLEYYLNVPLLAQIPRIAGQPAQAAKRAAA